MTTSFIRALAASALLIAAAGSDYGLASAQSGAPANAASTPWAALPAGVYKLDIALPENPLPATLTIKDSSGVATATFLPEGEQEAMAVKVTVKNPELIINGEGPKGPFEIGLQHQGSEITGRWSYGGDTGKLTGKVQPDIAK
jgi:hypothetical protein